MEEKEALEEARRALGTEENNELVVLYASGILIAKEVGKFFDKIYENSWGGHVGLKEVISSYKRDQR